LSGVGAKVEYFASEKLSIGIGGILIPNHRIESTTSENGSTTSTVGGNYMWEHNEIYLGTNIMLTGTLGTRGLYINPAVGYRTTRISEFSDFKLSGSLSSPVARLTMGYQWILAKHLRLAAGGGLTVAQSSAVVVKDASGKEVLRENSTSLGGLALDLQVGYIF